MPELQDVELPIYYPNARFEVEKQLARTEFACDLSVCKGACCTMPGALGAPVLEIELKELDRVFPVVKKYLSEEALEVISREGTWRKERDGSYTIPAVRGADCVFVMYDGDVAKCAIEKAYLDNEITGFKKPLSCHLYPIRIYPTKTKGTYSIVYEAIDECAGGRSRGRNEEIPLLDFLESPLVRALGDERATTLRKMIVD